MKELIIVVLLGLAGYLAWDDYNRNTLLSGAQTMLTQVTAERDAAHAQLQTRGVSVQTSWFQQRTQERPSLETPGADVRRPDRYDGTPATGSIVGSPARVRR